MTAHKSVKAELQQVKAEKLNLVEASKLLAQKLDTQTKVVKTELKKSTIASTTKVLDVKDYIKTYDTVELHRADDKRKIKDRFYIERVRTDGKIDSLSTTFYYAITDKEAKTKIHLDTETCRKLLQTFLTQHVEISEKFLHAKFRKLFRTEGSSYGDLERTCFKEVAIHVNSIADLTEELKAKMKSLNKTCIEYNISANAQKPIYECVRVF